jgi:tetratricopeptide (TPR) repeat protein
VRAAQGFYARNRHPQAEEALQLATEMRPDYPSALLLEARRLVLDEPQQALDLLARLDPDIRGTRAAESVQAVGLYLVGRRAEALTVAEQVLDLRPDDLDMLRVVQIVQRELDDVAPLLRRLNRALEQKRGPTVRLWEMVAETHLDLGDVEAARSAYQEGLAAAPRDIGCLRRLGYLEANAGRWPQAIAMFERIVATAPADKVALLELGDARRLSGAGFEAAIDAYDMALQIDDRFARALTGRGLALIALEKRELGLVDLRAAQDLAPTDEVVAMSYAQVVAGTDEDEAVRALRAWVEHDPDQCQAALDAGQLLESEGHLKAAVPFFEQASASPALTVTARTRLVEIQAQVSTVSDIVRVSGSDPELLPAQTAAIVAEAWTSMGDLSEAARWVGSATERAPDDVYVNAVRASVRLAEGELQEAEDAARKALRTDPDNQFATCVLGRTRRQRGDSTEAAELLGSYIAAAESDGDVVAPDIRAEYADALVLTGRAADALPHAERAANEEPDSAFALGIYATALRACGELDRALETATNALAMPNAASWIALERVLCHIDLEQTQEALAFARQAVAERPDDPVGLIALAVALEQEDEYTEAAELLDRPDVRASNPWVAERRGLELVLLARHEDAAAELEALDKSVTLSGDGLAALARAYIWTEPARLEEAVTCSERIANGDWFSLISLGEAHAQLGHDDLALDAYQRAEQLLRDSRSATSFALHGLAWVVMKQGRARDAVRLFDRAIALHETPVLDFDLGFTLLHTRHPEQAIEQYDRGLESLGKINDALRARAICLQALQELRRAVGIGELQAGTDVEQIAARLAARMATYPVPTGTRVTSVQFDPAGGPPAAAVLAP